MLRGGKQQQKAVGHLGKYNVVGMNFAGHRLRCAKIKLSFYFTPLSHLKAENLVTLIPDKPSQLQAFQDEHSQNEHSYPPAPFPKCSS